MSTDFAEADRAAIHEELDRLLNIIERLRSPGGCPWDQVQTTKDIARYLMDEACEVVDAIHDGSPQELKEELGDLLFQIIFLAKIADEEGSYDLGQVMCGIADKMIRRHPHVFGDAKADTVDDIRENWEAIKQREKGSRQGEDSVLKGVPRSLPTLERAVKITKKAARVGFDWPSIDGVIEKVEEELEELRAALSGNNRERTEEELGDLLFSVVNLSRQAGIDPDRALRGSIGKFTDRFTFMEKRLAREGSSLESASLEEMDRIWEMSKTLEKKGEHS